jgi:glycosyltransferase involved in cell wall biosynthesis
MRRKQPHRRSGPWRPGLGPAVPETRVLFVCPRFLPDVGGVESHVYEVARRLVCHGLEVTVLTTDRSRRLPAGDMIDGIHISRVSAWPRTKDYYLAPRVTREVAAARCDVMHVHSHHTCVAPLAMIAAVRRRLPFVVTFHGLGHPTPLRGPARRAQVSVLRPLLGRAAKLIALTQTECDVFRRLLRLPLEQFVVIPNGGDRLLETGSQDPPSRRAPVIASVGRLERFKGHHRLVTALPGVLERHPDARLLIIGNGPEEMALRALAVEAGVEERVRIVGIPLTDRATMASLLGKASIVALLSEGEGHPLAMLEAAALGRPLLVTDAPGLRELVDERIAAGVPLRAPPDVVAGALIAQLDRPLMPDSMAIPTWDASIDALVAVYRAAAHTRLQPDDPCYRHRSLNPLLPSRSRGGRCD